MILNILIYTKVWLYDGVALITQPSLELILSKANHWVTTIVFYALSYIILINKVIFLLAEDSTLWLWYCITQRHKKSDLQFILAYMMKGYTQTGWVSWAELVGGFTR